MKKKTILFFSLMLFMYNAKAQVGVNTALPNATFDIVGKKTIGAADGVIPPRISKQQLAEKTSGTYANPQTGAIVYVDNVASPAGTLPSLTQVSEVDIIGYYYFNGNLWKKLGTTADTSIYTNDGTLTGNRVVTQGNATLKFNATSVNAFSVDASTFSVDGLNHRVGIGTTSPSRKLHVDANNAPVRLENLTTVPPNTLTNGIVIDANGDLYKNTSFSAEGQIIRIGINNASYNANTENALRLNLENTPAGMGNAPNNAPNFINTIIGSSITNNVNVAGGNGAPARTTDQITLLPGTYKIVARLAGSFGGANNSNYLFLKAVVNNNEYSINYYSNPSGQTGASHFEDYINIAGTVPQTLDFTISPFGSAFNVVAAGTPPNGPGYSFRSIITIQKLR